MVIVLTFVLQALPLLKMMMRSWYLLHVQCEAQLNTGVAYDTNAHIKIMLYENTLRIIIFEKKSTLINIFCLQYRIMSHQASSGMHSLSALLQNLKDVQRCQCIYLHFRNYPLLNNHRITFSHRLPYSLTL